MTKNKSVMPVSIAVLDTSKIKDQSFHRSFKKWLPGIEKVFSDYALGTKGLKLKSKKIATIGLTLTFCGERKIKSLNRDFRNKDKVTDVLSFPLYESLRPEQCDPLYTDHLELGDVVICLPVARRQAVEFDVSLIEEVVHQLVHGLLHLVGFDHERGGEEEKLMNRLEEQLVATIYHIQK